MPFSGVFSNGTAFCVGSNTQLQGWSKALNFTYLSTGDSLACECARFPNLLVRFGPTLPQHDSKRRALSVLSFAVLCQTGGMTNTSRVYCK